MIYFVSILYSLFYGKQPTKLKFLKLKDGGKEYSK